MSLLPLIFPHFTSVRPALVRKDFENAAVVCRSNLSTIAAITFFLEIAFIAVESLLPLTFIVVVSLVDDVLRTSIQPFAFFPAQEFPTDGAWCGITKSATHWDIMSFWPLGGANIVEWSLRLLFLVDAVVHTDVFQLKSAVELYSPALRPSWSCCDGWWLSDLEAVC